MGCVVGAVPEELTALAASLSSSSSATGFCSSFTDSDLVFAVAYCHAEILHRTKERQVVYRQLTIENSQMESYGDSSLDQELKL